MAKKARPIVPLVILSNEGDGRVTYTRYVGREPTHRGTIDWYLEAEEVEEYRRSPENWYAQGR